MLGFFVVCFENFHSHWSFSGLAVVSWGFFAVVKNCDKLNVRGELCCAAHVAVTVAPPPLCGWEGATFSPTRVAGKNVVFFSVCFALFSFYNC